MKVLHLSTSDIEGGAARAAYRLHRGLQGIGVNSQMLVRAKDSIDKTVIAEKSALTKLGPSLNSLPLRFYSGRKRTLFSPQWVPDAIAAKVHQLQPDILTLQWVCNGFLQVETLARLGKPMVWTLHDMWAFTGGCHYAADCNNYTRSCGKCPQLGSQRSRDLSHWVWHRKSKSWKNLNLTIVSPSHWLADCARSSPLFSDRRIEVIQHGLDLSQYRPVERRIARQLLNLPQDKYLSLFGASPGTTGDPRKGFQFLQPALQQLLQSGWQDKLELVIFGGDRPDNAIDLGFKTHYLGQLHDDLSLALVYSAADVMVVPSVQEAFGQTASEALACGTPVVAFNATGLKDIVEHQQNGYLVKPYEVEDLAQGIAWVLEDSERHQNLRLAARKKAEQTFSLEVQAKQYATLFESILISASSNQQR